MTNDKSKRRDQDELFDAHIKNVGEYTQRILTYLAGIREDCSQFDAIYLAYVIAKAAHRFIRTTDDPEVARHVLDRLDRELGSATASPDAKLLRAMVADPGGTQADWATATDVAKSTVYRRLKRLQEHGLVRGAEGRWAVTQTGTQTI
jgi:hypothetical protein